MTDIELVDKLEQLRQCCEPGTPDGGCGACPYRKECEDNKLHEAIRDEVVAVLSSRVIAKDDSANHPSDKKDANDPVNHPSHYIFSNGAEVIDITENLNFCRGNAVKYLCRAGRKLDELEDLKKARFYVDREIARLEKAHEQL